MRVVAGSHGGRRLAAPPGQDTRPTSDRVREAVFSSLGERVRRARVLDLYAGSGAMGIEALSRGAAAVTFVEADRRAVEVIRRNLDDLGLDAGPRGGVLRTTAEAFGAAPTGGHFHLVLADPPYSVPLPDVMAVLGRLREASALAARARVVIERSRRDQALARGGEPRIALPGFLAFDRARSYGDTVVLQLAVTGSAQEPDAAPRRDSTPDRRAGP